MPAAGLIDRLSNNVIGFGGAQVGNLYRPTDDEVAAAAVETAWDQHIRYFDTAPHYGLGLSERRLGAVLANHTRSEFVLSTKVGRLLEPQPSAPTEMDDGGFAVPASFRRRWDFSRDGVLRSIEESLERLGLDKIDVAYLHDPDDHWEAASTSGVKALVELREQNVLGAVGVGMNQSAMLTDFVEQTDVDIVMVAGRYTLLEQGAASDLLPAAHRRDVAVVAAGIFNSGLLSGSTGGQPMYNYQPAPTPLVARARRIAEIASGYGVTLPQAAIAFPLRHPAVVSAVIGMRTPAQVVENLDLAQSAVPEDLWLELEANSLL